MVNTPSAFFKLVTERTKASSTPTEYEFMICPASVAIPISHTTMITFRVCLKTASIKSMYSPFPSWRLFEAKKAMEIVETKIRFPSAFAFPQISVVSSFPSIRLKRKDESATRIKLISPNNSYCRRLQSAEH